MEHEPARVLLIEDNPGDADLVRLRLVEGKSEVQVNCVPRLADALAVLDVDTPTLVLLDLNLPDSHGAETFRRIMQKAPNVPVVILSGQDDETLANKAVHMGVQDYLVKGDITSKQLERALRYAMERQGLMRALEATRKQQLEFKNQFLSHVSHELRTPLTCIYQYVTLLLDGLAGPMAPDQTDHLKTVLKSTNQLHAMIRDLLEATRAESGKLRIEPRCIDIGELMQQAVAMMRPAAAEKRIGLEAVLDQTIPLVYADPDRTLEVLINLIDNGIKFTPPEGSVIVKASMVETDPSSVYLSVNDSGRGIPQEALPQVFERLYQDPNAVDGNRTGLGLGLYIAKEIVTLHGGRMWVASQPGKRQHLLIYFAALFTGQAAASGDHCPGTFAGGYCAGARGADSALQITARKLERNLPALSGTFAPVRLRGQGSGSSTDGEQRSRRNIFRGRLHRHGEGRHHDGPHPGTSGRAAAVEGQRHFAGDGRADSGAARGRPEDSGATSLGRCRLRHRNYSAGSSPSGTSLHRKGEP